MQNINLYLQTQTNILFFFEFVYFIQKSSISHWQTHMTSHYDIRGEFSGIL